jgi:hypothetical protein
MKDHNPNKLSNIRHELADIVGGLSSASDLIKNIPGTSTIERILHLSHAKIKEVMTAVDKTKTDLLGSYLLEKCEIKRPEISEFIPWGQNVHGHLMYTAEGRVSVSINREGLSSEDSLFYAGKFELLGEGKLQHIITECSNKQKIGKIKPITYEFKNNRLFMIVHAEYGDISVIWSRV